MLTRSPDPILIKHVTCFFQTLRRRKVDAMVNAFPKHVIVNLRDKFFCGDQSTGKCLIILHSISMELNELIKSQTRKSLVKE